MSSFLSAIAICRVPSLLTMSQIRSRIGDLGWATQALVFTVTVDIVLCIFSGAIVLYAFKKGRLRWTFLHFLVEVAMIFLPRALYITVVIAVALRVDGSLDLLMQRLWSDLRLAFEVTLVSLCATLSSTKLSCFYSRMLLDLL